MAVLTVGTGKTYATISAAIAAAASGDSIEVYATTGNTYTEQVNYAGKALMIRGLVANQGLTITYNGTVVTIGASGVPGCLENFKIVKSGAVGSTGIDASSATSLTSRVQNCVVAGFSIGIYVYTSAVRVKNCIVHDCTTGYKSYGTVGSAPVNCGAFKCTTGFTSNTAGQNYPLGCLAAGNTTDFANTAPSWSAWNVSADGTAPGAGSVTGFDTGDFVDYANNDFRLKAAVKDTTKARLPGCPLEREDYLGQVRRRAGVFYAGAHDPDPGVVPDGACVRTTVGAFGLDNEKTPTCTVPAAGELKTGTQCGAGGNEITGTRTDAAAANVKTGSGTYGDPGSPFTPAYAPDFPDRQAVLVSDTVDGQAGRWHPADAAKYQLGEQFGVDGVSETGAYDPAPVAPAAPTLAVRDDESGSSLTAVVTGDPGVTNKVYRRPEGAPLAPWTLGGARTGDGEVPVTGLALGGRYRLVAVSELEGALSLPSAEAAALVTDGELSPEARIQANVLYILRNDARLAARAADWLARVTARPEPGGARSGGLGRLPRVEVGGVEIARAQSPSAGSEELVARLALRCVLAGYSPADAALIHDFAGDVLLALKAEPRLLAPELVAGFDCTVAAPTYAAPVWTAELALVARLLLDPSNRGPVS